MCEPYEGDEFPCDGCGEDIPQRCDINSPDGHQFLCDDCYDPELEAGTLYLERKDKLCKHLNYCEIRKVLR